MSTQHCPVAPCTPGSGRDGFVTSCESAGAQTKFRVSWTVEELLTGLQEFCHVTFQSILFAESG